MATTLNSPGVLVSVVDDSFYTSAAPGTVPLIIVASAANKINSSGVVAPGTAPSASGTVYLATSQRDLADNYGTPLFYTDADSNPINGGELNEYGLQAAYSYLGVSSAAYIVRAPIDLSTLAASASVPAGAPADGSYWVDTTDSLYGIFQWNQTTGLFANQVPLVIDDTTSALSTVNSAGLVPAPSVGTIGQYAIVATDLNKNTVWFKNTDANWVQVGSVGDSNFVNNSATSTFKSTVWTTSWPTVLGANSPSSLSSGTITINSTTITVLGTDLPANVATTINSSMHVRGVGAKVINGALAIYADSTATSNGSVADGCINIASTYTGLLTQLGIATGLYQGPTVFIGPHTQYPNFNSDPTGSVYLKTTNPNLGANWVVKEYSATANTFNVTTASIYAGNLAAIYAFDPAGGGVNIPVGTLYIESNFDRGDGFHSTSTSLCRPILGEFQIKERIASSPTVITSNVTTGTVTINSGTVQISVSIPGNGSYTNFQSIVVSSGTPTNLVLAINNSGIANLSAAYNTNGTVSITHATGGEIRFIDSSSVLGSAKFLTGSTANFYHGGAYEPTGTQFKASNWAPLSYTSSPVEPTTVPANGTIWYDSITDQVDLLYNTGTSWLGYGNAFPGTDPNGPIVAFSQPTTQSDGVSALVNGDVWVSTADLDLYGQEVYVYNGTTQAWVLQDVTDHTTPHGWIFADARWATNGEATLPSTITSLKTSNYVDPDAPDPTLYPRGTILWNLRRSGFNVKQYVKGYINVNANNGYNLRVPTDPLALYNVDRWVSVSPNNSSGVGSFGRYAQRSFVVASLKALIDGNTAIRDTDTLNFNLIACPGYPEAVQNMIGLNTDRGVTAFVVGDTPFRLPSDPGSLQAWGQNTNNAVDNGDIGAVSYDDYTAFWYPSGYTNDLTGNYIVVPPSHMMLTTIATSDQNSYEWFAPAGIRRGVITNATSVGYIDESGDFVTASLPQATRDVMATAKINPIATLTGAGIVAYGQYTRANAASSLDRINVARLVCYVRRQLDILARPYLFEPNDSITQSELKNAAQSFFTELVGQRALYDFIVVCDSSNNTPDRVDRNELWMDIAIEPVKSIEFIYIPIRLVNTGSIAAGTFTLD